MFPVCACAVTTGIGAVSAPFPFFPLALFCAAGAACPPRYQKNASSKRAARIPAYSHLRPRRGCSPVVSCLGVSCFGGSAVGGGAGGGAISACGRSGASISGKGWFIRRSYGVKQPGDRFCVQTHVVVGRVFLHGWRATALAD